MYVRYAVLNAEECAFLTRFTTIIALIGQGATVLSLRPCLDSEGDCIKPLSKDHG